MEKGRPTVSRRDFFGSFLRHVTPEPAAAAVQAKAESAALPKKAIIQGRFCLAYQNSFCSVCSERCPEPGAIVSEVGIPRIVADACTGCGICHDVCPAPRNAILMAPLKSARPQSVSP